MEGKKNWKILVWVAMVLCMAMPNRVEASEENSYIIPILETVWVEENEQQGSRMGVPQASIGSGKTVSFLDSSGSMFYVLGGTTVNFTVKLSTSGSVQMGYINNSGTKTGTYSGTGSSHSTSFTISTTGYYRFYVTNQSSSTLQTVSYTHLTLPTKLEV